MGAEVLNANRQLRTPSFLGPQWLWLQCVSCIRDLQHSMGLEEACRDTVRPLGWLMCTRNTSLTRVFLRPMSVSPLRSSMSELRSFRIPAQSILREKTQHVGEKRKQDADEMTKD